MGAPYSFPFRRSRTARVVGGVDDDALHMGIQRRFNGGDIQAEGVPRCGHLHHLRPGPLDEDPVFGEIGGDDHEFVPGTAQPLQTGAQRRGRAAGEKQVAPRAPGVKAAVQRSRDGIARLQVPGGAGVSMDGVPVFPGQYVHYHLIHPGRRGHGGVAQGKVQHIFRPDLSAPLLSIFKQHPHGIALGPQLAHGFRNHFHHPSRSPPPLVHPH